MPAKLPFAIGDVVYLRSDLSGSSPMTVSEVKDADWVGVCWLDTAKQLNTFYCKAAIFFKGEQP